MNASIRLADLGHPFLGSRLIAKEVRLQLEAVLRESGEARIDFQDIGATQSFVDELVGVLFAREGRALLNSIVFANCSADIRAILQFVIGSRLRDFDELIRAGAAQKALSERVAIA